MVYHKNGGADDNFILFLFLYIKFTAVYFIIFFLILKIMSELGSDVCSIVEYPRKIRNKTNNNEDKEPRKKSSWDKYIERFRKHVRTGTTLFFEIEYGIMFL